MPVDYRVENRLNHSLMRAPQTDRLYRGARTVEDRRKHLRMGLGEPGYISSGGACWCCNVINISAEGAAIELADPSLAPDRFLLMILKDRRLFSCRLAW